MNNGIREEFYSALRREFKEDDFTKSFLYRYLKKEKDDGILRGGAAASGRDGPYVLLKTSFMELEQGKLSQEDCLRVVLDVLAKTSKLHLEKSVRELLWEYGRRLCGREMFDGLRRDKQRYEAMRRALEKGAPAGRLGSGDWERLREEVLKRVLEIDAKTFMYDAGFPLSAEQEETIDRRKKDRLLDMFNDYCEEKQLFLQRRSFAGQDAQGLSSGQKQRIEAFYQQLRQSRRGESMLIPIRIDPLTGVGLYIVGRRYYRQTVPNLSRSIQGSCCYAVFFLDDIPPEDDPDIPEEERQVFLRCIEDDERDFPHLDEALSWYKKSCRENGCRYFRFANGEAPAGCPKELRLYFEGGPARDGGDAEDLAVSRDDIEAAAAECGEPAERRMRHG